MLFSLQYHYGFRVCLLPLAHRSNIGDEEGREGRPLPYDEPGNDVSSTVGLQ